MNLFTFNVTVHSEPGEDDYKKIIQKLDLIMSAQSDLTLKIQTVTAQIQKISAESSATLQRVKDLQAVIDAGPPVTPELQAAVDELATQVQVVDDLTPDLSNGSGVV